MLKPIASLALGAVFLTACGATDDLYLVPETQIARSVAVRAGSLEIRDIVLPAYGADADILVQEEDGALRPLGGALWADEPLAGLTRSLADRLDRATTAVAAPAPWPLFDGPDRAVQVTVDRMVARNDGQFALAGQFAMISASGNAREFIRRFDILQPYAAATPQAITDALGRALDALALEIAGSIQR